MLRDAGDYAEHGGERAILQGAMDLLALQTERKTLEEALRAHFEGTEAEL